MKEVFLCLFCKIFKLKKQQKQEAKSQCLTLITISLYILTTFVYDSMQSGFVFVTTFVKFLNKHI